MKIVHVYWSCQIVVSTQVSIRKRKTKVPRNYPSMEHCTVITCLKLIETKVALYILFTFSVITTL